MPEPIISRQDWLRTRPRVYSAADSRPVEAAVLEPRADTMRDMVRQYVAQKHHEDTSVDEPFLSEEEFDMELDAQPLSEHQLSELALDILAMQDQGEADLDASGVDVEGSPEPDPAPGIPEPNHSAT